MRMYSTFLITVAMYQYNGSKSDNTNVIFLPSVVYYPINSMPWAYREAKEHFPFDTPVCFWQEGTFINKSVQMVLNTLRSSFVVAGRHAVISEPGDILSKVHFRDVILRRPSTSEDTPCIDPTASSLHTKNTIVTQYSHKLYIYICHQNTAAA